jgi:AraC family transcriptional regulator
MNELGELPENVSRVSVEHRRWNGVAVDVLSIYCSGRVVSNLGYSSQDRIGANLEEISKSPTEARWHPNKPCAEGSYSPRQMMLAPAGMEAWGYSGDVRFVKAATLTFNSRALEERLQINLSSRPVDPRLRFTDDRIWILIKMLADAVGDADPSAQLYGDGLTAAITARLLAPADNPERKPARLAPWQLQRVLEYLDQHMPERVQLADLAALVGLSQSHFSRAFKAATGYAPYQWQLAKRINLVQDLLLDTRGSLEQIAVASGFADAVHMSRTFRKFTGTSPASWRRDRKS